MSEPIPASSLYTGTMMLMPSAGPTLPNLYPPSGDGMASTDTWSYGEPR